MVAVAVVWCFEISCVSFESTDARGSSAVKYLIVPIAEHETISLNLKMSMC